VDSLMKDNLLTKNNHGRLLSHLTVLPCPFR
jgi:hypothetical protein